MTTTVDRCQATSPSNERGSPEPKKEELQTKYIKIIYSFWSFVAYYIHCYYSMKSWTTNDLWFFVCFVFKLVEHCNNYFVCLSIIHRFWYEESRIDNKNLLNRIFKIWHALELFAKVWCSIPRLKKPSISQNYFKDKWSNPESQIGTVFLAWNSFLCYCFFSFFVISFFSLFCCLAFPNEVIVWSLITKI